MLSEFALYSDRLFMAAVSVYVLAMVLHGAEYAVQRSAKAVLVGAGGPALDTRSDEPRPDAPAGRSRAERFGRMGVSLVVLGAVLHAASIVLRGLAAQRWPLGNMYEFTSAICLAAIVAWLVMLRRSPAARPVGLFVLLPVVILLFLGGTVLYAPAAPVMPALQSYWLVVHVTTVSIASGLLMVPGVASLLFLLRRSGRLADFADKLPSADALDRLAYRVTIVAFPLYTFAIMAGAIWAEAAWGRFWGWDPKETVAFVAWVIYAAYLHARATAGWRNGPAAWVNVAGFAAIVFNFFFINMVVSGLHSYAGLG
ncbi:c-type cytochrome biogenesis protein CcsB [Pseudonocardia sp. CA-142604]|uniref:c-type cytochrome biogenesis protein CcsB n=1 Tax=Pseudonocardia sp. CA-142604 TaxID=3240024 RepID=UPI003D935193